MNFQDYLAKAMVGQLILRMDIIRTSAGTDVEAEAINYWSDDEGACVIHLEYSRSQSIPKIQIDVVTQAFMKERRQREIKHHLQSIVAAWNERDWDLQRDKVVRVRHLDAPDLRWEYSNPLNILVAQDLARLQTAIELTMANPLEVSLCDLLAGEQLLRSELWHTLREASRRLDAIIRDADRQLASITQF